MKNSLSLFICGLFLCGNVLASDSGYQADLLATLQIYAKQNNIGLNKPTDNFMGFSITTAGSESSVTVYHADSPVDIVTNDYTCKDSACELIARNPRCFYYTPGSSHAAMALYDVALLLAQTPRDWKFDQLKFWQLGNIIYGRITNATSMNNEFYACQQQPQGLICESTSELPDEP
ncbi:hypothetical protein ACLVWU_06370 [Bdellovibrio sp. HCB290]|uniref:hypothetical protein n=1 Tax=Bdellovibrio sp. HCB290 TaxID=3394356 RepID=UPI0039B5F663